MLANQGHTIGESRFWLFVPSGGQDRHYAIRLETMGQEGDQREHSQQARSGTCNRQIAPLTLSLQSEVLARLFKGDLQRPAHDKPLNDLPRRCVEFSRGEDLVGVFSLWVPSDHEANRHRRLGLCMPESCAREDQDLFALSAVPINFGLFPGNIAARRPFFERALTRSFEWLDARFAWRLLARWMIQSRVPPQACHQLQVGRPGANQRQLDRGISAIDSQNDQSLRHPAMNQSSQNHQDINHRLVLARSGLRDNRVVSRFGLPLRPGLFAAARFASPCVPDFRLLPVLLAATDRRQKRQRPDPAAPGQAHQDRHREPLQAVAVDGSFAGRSDRIAPIADGFDLSAASAFNRIVSGDDHYATGRQQRDDQSQQNLARPQGVPFRPIENPMIVLKMLLFDQPNRTQARSHSSFTARQQHTHQQNFGVFPNWLGKERLENYNQVQQFGRQCSHMEDLSWRKFLPKLTLPAVTFSKNKYG